MDTNQMAMLTYLHTLHNVHLAIPPTFYAHLTSCKNMAPVWRHEWSYNFDVDLIVQRIATAWCRQPTIPQNSKHRAHIGENRLFFPQSNIYGNIDSFIHRATYRGKYSFIHRATYIWKHRLFYPQGNIGKILFYPQGNIYGNIDSFIHRATYRGK